MRFSAAQLVEQAHSLQVPFQVLLQIDAQEYELECKEIFRILPGHRIVCRAKLQGVEVLLKLFLGARHKRHWDRELQGVQALADASVVTPKLLHALSDPYAQLSYQIFSYIEPLPASDGPNPEQRLIGIAGVLAQLHNDGLVHTDLHMNNFLFNKSEIFVIDGDAVQKKSTVSGQEGVKNLAELIAQLNSASSETIENCVDAYLDRRAGLSSIDLRKLTGRALKIRKKRLDKILQKAQRDCSAFFCSADKNHFFICERSQYDSMQVLIADLDAWVERGERIKSGNTATLACVEVQRKRYIIKRYNIKSRWHALNRALRMTRARRSWLNAQILHFYDIPTAKAVAVYEERCGPFRGRAFLIMEYLDGTLLSEEPQPIAATLGTQICALFNSLYKARIVHGDTKASNFVSVRQTKTQLKIIDLDSLRYAPSYFESKFQKDINRFLRNFPEDKELRRTLVESLARVKGFPS